MDGGENGGCRVDVDVRYDDEYVLAVVRKERRRGGMKGNKHMRKTKRRASKTVERKKKKIRIKNRENEKQELGEKINERRKRKIKEKTTRE